MKKIILIIVLCVSHLLCIGIGCHIASVCNVSEQPWTEIEAIAETLEQKITEERVMDALPETELEIVPETVTEETEMMMEATEQTVPAHTEIQPAATIPPATQPPVTNPTAPQPPVNGDNYTSDDEL